ncbi:trehalose utilization-domain-containing protein [Cristinia sonorae]|uniref:Trehalose utilization-domain-containing protein n=1 Tax=Cristinia sonorae TaxID=1940300 RepID=A0A8K0UNR4_9AGAR|nr:trehalose utilization-domain-containing protein [Cristinia sonorae]
MHWLRWKFYDALSIVTFSAVVLPAVTAQRMPATAQALIFSATLEFRHDSIPTAIQAMKDAGDKYNVQFDDTEDQAWFKDGRINKYDTLVFLDNTGEVLDDAAQTAFQNYINSGGNFVGIHAASDCLRNSTFFANELGAHFDYHPQITNATIDVVDPSHPSTSMLPEQWQVFDEIYNFKSDPRSIGAVVLLSADESSYSDPGPRRYDQGNPHPIAWYQDHGAGSSSQDTAGRSWYTSLGHTNETWQNPLYIAHVLGGISWVLQSNTTSFTNPAAAIGSGPATNSTNGNNNGGTTTTTEGAPGPTNTPSAGLRVAANIGSPRWILLPIIIAIAIMVG